MENASQALIIAGAILLAILIIAIGMYIYNSAQANISSSMDSMSTSEIEAFNSNFETYKGVQTGAQISALCGRLIANGSTYKDEPGRVPEVVISSTNWNGCVADTGKYRNDINAYSSSVAAIKNAAQNKHKYLVTFGYDGSTGLLNSITIDDAD